MKLLTKSSIGFISAFIILYLFGSFYEVSFNIAEWQDVTRLFIVMFGFLFGIVAAILAVNSEFEQE